MTPWDFRWFGFALVLAAPLPQALGQEQPVYLLLPGKDGEELVRVEGGKGGEPSLVGQGCLYGVTKGKLAIVGTFAEKEDKKKAVLQVYDSAARRMTLRLDLPPEPVRFTEGPVAQVLFNPAGDRLCYVSVEDKKVDEKNISEFSVNIVDLQTRKVSRHPLARELTNPCLTALPDGMMGIYSVIGCQRLYSLSWKGGKVEELWSDVAEKAFAVADVVGVPGKGVFRIGRDGKTIERILGSDLRKTKEKGESTREAGVCRPLAAALDGKSVLVWGERAPDADTITKLVLYDPAKGKALWQKQLPFGAETFTISPDCRFFYLIDREKPALAEFDRTNDRFTRILDIQARPIIHSVAVILIPKP